jgi:pimeloyl-ACP methyl ester carboxylesterase
MSVAIRRRFLQVGERRVHYLRAGDGPPAVLVHSSPANAWFLMPEIERLSADYTVFAFDTPGFGLSEPLPLQEMIVADLADALAETLSAIDMPPCPMFGTHSGAAIALEFAVRHPERVTGLVLDGVPAFTQEECAALFGDYFRKLPVSDLGGHYAAAWTRFRDQTVWFPWSHRRPENLNGYDLSGPESTHLWVSMYFDAAETYTPAYYATSHYGARAIEAAAELTLPAIYTATDTDMLFPHLARLPPLKDGQSIRLVGTSYELKRELIAEGFTRFGARGEAPPDRDGIGSGSQVKRQFIEGDNGRQIHLRYAGDRVSPALLLLHDAPGSTAQLEPLIEALGRHWFVIAPDLPGSGESDPRPGTPSIADFAAEAERLLAQLGIATIDVYGIGFGSSVAAELALSTARVSSLSLQGLLLPDQEERQALAANYTPPISVEPDGAHWYRTWLMLRDSRIWWPWFDRRLATQRRTPASFDGDELHRWTTDVMRRRGSYHHLIQAALAHDLAGALAQLKPPVIQLINPITTLSVFDGCVSQRLPNAGSLDVGADLAGHAAELFQRLGRLSPTLTKEHA